MPGSVRGVVIVSAVLAVVAGACTDTASTVTTTLPPTVPATSTTAPGATTSTSGLPPGTGTPTTTEATGTTAASTTTEPELTAPIGSFRVTGVAADDVLNVRRGAGVENEIVGVFPSNAVGIRTTGAAELAADGGTWWQVEQFASPEPGWVNASFLGPADQPPCSNEDGALALPSVFVVAPRPGARVGSGFTVVGCSRSFESTFGWRLRDAGGAVLAEGFAMGGGVDAPGSFGFTVDYSGVTERQLGSLEVSEDDPSDGEGSPPVRNVIPLFLTEDGGPVPVNPLDPCSASDGVVTTAFGVIVTEPFSGQRAGSGFALAGCSNTFEATVPWRLLDGDGSVIADGFTMGGGTDFDSFRTTIDYSVDELQIGMLVVEEDDVSDGEGLPPVVNVIPVVLRP